MGAPYSTETLLAPMNQEAPTNMFLLDMLFDAIELSMTENINIDIIKGDERLAPFVSPKVEGKVMLEQGFSTRSYKMPYIKPKYITQASELIAFRQAGENPFEGSPSDREIAKMAKNTREGENTIFRREEAMASEALFTGKITVIGDGINDVIDFGLDANHTVTLSGTDLWSDTTNSDPIQDLIDWSQLIADDGNANANILIGDSATIQALINNDKVKSRLDNRRIISGEISPSKLPTGAVYYGTLIETGVAIDIYSYMGGYIDDNGVRQRFVPAGKVLLTSTEADFRRNYGAIADLEAGLQPIQIFPKYRETFDPSVGELLLQSSPLPAPHQIDAIVVATVIV